ncbi:Gfo/Idh/MocA family protein [Peribacillus glennii]|uniref:Gfo/Idh/MocA family oxidoreductase n=1 Tax=Peribacillus glennii TaxID=2303991 RepID=A0A372L8N2_9BACI|nr:Gfo/Idh/MocA family oxidoreductase [Peribacillus glennii]RFU61802.1 gfo/Idh/MocA family oxidoreductase [Peribacillus glennii]
MNNKIKWGILSTANIAVEQLIPAIRKSSNGEVYAIASSSGRAADAAHSLQIPVAYDSYEQLLADPYIDAVYIPLPNNMHYEWTIKAAKANKHVLCEKPAALEVGQLEDMISACKENGVLFMEGFMYRFHPQHQKVKDLLAEKAIGNIKMVRACFSFYMEDREGNIRLNPELGGGALYDIGSYCVNSINNILGTEPLSIEVTAEMNQDGVDTTASAALFYPGNIHATLMCSFDAVMKNEYEIIGSNGSIRVPHSYRPDLNSGVGIVELTQENEYRKFTIYGDQYLLEVEHFADCVINNKKPVYSGESSLMNLKVVKSLIERIK